MNLLPQPLLRLSLDEVGRRRAGTLPLLLRTCRGSDVRRRGLSTISRATQRCAVIVPHHERPDEASGAEAGRLAHLSQPGGGTSSSGTSTTAALGLPAAAGADEVDATATATIVVTAMTDAACYGSATVVGYRGSATVAACCASEVAAAPRESSPAVVAVLPAARDTLDQRRLVGMAASDLSTLAGARGARWVPPYEREDERVKLSPT
jgi:hypothetical protein